MTAAPSRARNLRQSHASGSNNSRRWMPRRDLTGLTGRRYREPVLEPVLGPWVSLSRDCSESTRDYGTVRPLLRGD